MGVSSTSLPIAPDLTDGRALLEHSNKEAFWDRLSLGLALLTAFLVISTFREYGVTWDEDVHSWYGNLVLDYYLSFLHNSTALHWRDLYNYGAVFDMLAAALTRVSPFGVYETRHFLNGIVGVLGLVGCWKLARATAGARAGFIATLFLVLTPNYYGQMFNNPKDIPFAVGVVWGTYYIVQLARELPCPSLRLLTKLGAAIGMTLGVRIGGLFLLCYVGLVIVFDGAWQATATRRIWVLFYSVWINAWRVLVPVALFAYPIMLLFWPWAQIDPIDNPLRALAFFSHQTFPFNTLFDGQFIPATDLPWSYLPTFIAIALPELVLVLLLCAPIAIIFAFCDTPPTLRRKRALPIIVVVIGIVFPVVYAIIIKAVLFDGMRHFIFVLPLVAVLAAVVADRGLIWLARFRYRQAIYVTLALYGLAHVSIMTILHPDQYVYYNAFVGGVRGAQHKFNLDYWANSYAEVVQGLEDYLRTAYGAGFEEREFTVGVCGPPVSADYYFPPNFRFLRDGARAEFFIAFTKDDCDRSLPGRPIYRVERMGALLSLVLDRRDNIAQRHQHTSTGLATDHPASVGLSSSLGSLP
jgi:hypothetical protein